MELFYRQTGTGEPLLVLHGLFGTSDNWNTLAKKFGESFETYTIDQRNHGQSPHSEDFSYGLMVDDLAEFMQQHQLDSAHIIGHSMGGKTAMFFASTFPEKVKKLVVADISPRYYPPHHQQVIEALYAVPLDAISSRKEAEAIMEEKIRDFGTRQFLLKNLYWKDEKLAWRFNLDAITKNIENVGEALPGNAIFNGPVLFIRGEKSNYIGEDDMDAVSEHFPMAKLVTIPGAGHWVHAENPSAFLEETLAFLNN